MIDNEFLTTPLLKSTKGHKKGFPNTSYSKPEVINHLSEKNHKLKAQIKKIQRYIDEINAEDLKQRSISVPRQPIINEANNIDNLKKELATAYQIIKGYEAEIKKNEEAHMTPELVHQAKQLERRLEQKQYYTEKLKRQLKEQNSSIKKNTRKLHKQTKQHTLDKKLAQLTSEIKFLRDKEKQYRNKEEIKKGNLKRQTEYIKKVQRTIIEEGFSAGQLQEIKQRTMNRQERNNIQEQIEQEQDKIVEIRSLQAFQNMKDEIKLLQKIHNDHEKQFQKTEEQKQIAMLKNEDSRNTVLQIEHDIEKLEEKILFLKGEIIPSNMKPLAPLRYISSDFLKKKNKVSVSKSMNMGGGKSLSHLLNYKEVGSNTLKGQRFTDRTILGRQNLNSKITSIKVYLYKDNISGFQFTYSNKTKGGDYIHKSTYKLPNYETDTYTCVPMEWIKGINGTLNQNNYLESLSIITSNNNSHKFGNPANLEKSFRFQVSYEEFPVCVFGSMIGIGEKGEYSAIEHFGVQINSNQHHKQA